MAPDPAPFAEVIRQLTAYFAGELTEFSLDLAPRGTDFQQRIWQALDSVRYGTTITYGQLAAQLGVPRDRIQALGAAIGANPLAIIRPCHRVVGSDGGHARLRRRGTGTRTATASSSVHLVGRRRGRESSLDESGADYTAR